MLRTQRRRAYTLRTFERARSQGLQTWYFLLCCQGLTRALRDAELLPRIWVSGRVGEEPEARKLVPQGFMHDLVTGRLSGSYPKALFCSGDVQEGVCGSGPPHELRA